MTGSRVVTELVPEAPPLSAAELAELRTAFAEDFQAAIIVVLIGSLPPQTPTALYRGLVEQVQGKAIIDARGPELLEAVASRPVRVKPKLEELESTRRRLDVDCTAFDDGLGGAPTAHDANFLTFHRIPRFQGVRRKDSVAMPEKPSRGVNTKTEVQRTGKVVANQTQELALAVPTKKRGYHDLVVTMRCRRNCWRSSRR